ncbi:hypothetical protein CORC01_00812 [Colletotrichum orchidophilum]|uniref:Uncharacterized protein n=1 Tax=Colletotrichum orchidophilum TaxID=1209926 RepID=A0A1G4BRB0_9PEZI|nr:uncharacterized protein CORC01_00812 [Colletotrichum orchidophilum]OHF03950.1 hypothetical protein CORC01_00812 [Colletotrichum orchidophilum]
MFWRLDKATQSKVDYLIPKVGGVALHTAGLQDVATLRQHQASMQMEHAHHRRQMRSAYIDAGFHNAIKIGRGLETVRVALELEAGSWRSPLAILR